MNTHSDYIVSKEIYENHDTFKNNQKVVQARYYLDDLDFKIRVDFVLGFLKTFNHKRYLFEIQYWDNNDYLFYILNSYNSNYKILENYTGDESPGLILLDEENLNIRFLKELFQSHYNHDFAIEPSVNIQLYLFLKDKNKLSVIEFYDDRGFLVNHYLL